MDVIRFPGTSGTVVKVLAARRALRVRLQYFARMYWAHTIPVHSTRLAGTRRFIHLGFDLGQQVDWLAEFLALFPGIPDAIAVSTQMDE